MRFGRTGRLIKNNKAAVKRLFAVIGGAMLIVLLLIALVFFLSHFFHFGFFVGKNEEKNAKTGVIYQINSDTVRSMEAFDSGVAILTNSSLKYLDSSGRELESNKHVFSAPVMKIRDKNVLLYDKGGTGYRVEKNTSVYYDQNASGPIICGAIGKRGNYGFSINNDAGFQSHIYVYALNGDKQFEWGSASDYCDAMALSDSGGKIAVAVLGTDNADYYSKVMLFSFRSDAPVYTVDFPDETVFDLDFITSSKLAVYSDHGVYLINGNGVRTSVSEYPSNEIRMADVTQNRLRAVVTAPFGNEQAPVVNVFNNNGKSVFSRHYNGLISSVKCGDSYVGVLVDGRVELLNKDNIAVGSIDPGLACSDFAVVNHSLYTLTTDGISRYNVYFDTQRTEAETIQDVTKNDETTAFSPVTEIGSGDPDISRITDTDAESGAQTAADGSNSPESDETIDEPEEEEQIEESEDSEEEEMLFG